MNEVGMSANCGGHFVIEKLDNENNVIERYAKSNLITNYGLRKLSENGFNQLTFALFTDNEPISPTRWTLPTDKLDYGSSVLNNQKSVKQVDEANNQYIVVYTFEQLLTNNNIARNFNRIGILYDNNSNGGIVAVSAIINHRGEAVTISVNPSDRVRVIYTFTLTLDISDKHIQNVSLGKLGTADVTIRPGYVYRYQDTFSNNGISYQDNYMYFGNRDLLPINADLFTNMNRTNGYIKDNKMVVVSNNVATTTITATHLWSTSFSNSAHRKDGYDIVVINTSLLLYQIKFSKPLNYVSNKVNLQFKFIFTLRRTE